MDAELTSGRCEAQASRIPIPACEQPRSEGRLQWERGWRLVDGVWIAWLPGLTDLSSLKNQNHASSLRIRKSLLQIMTVSQGQRGSLSRPPTCDLGGRLDTRCMPLRLKQPYEPTSEGLRSVRWEGCSAWNLIDEAGTTHINLRGKKQGSARVTPHVRNPYPKTDFHVAWQHSNYVICRESRTRNKVSRGLQLNNPLVSSTTRHDDALKIHHTRRGIPNGQSTKLRRNSVVKLTREAPPSMFIIPFPS